MTDAQQRAAAKAFATQWKDKGYEKGDSQPFWLALLQNVYGVAHPELFISFEEQVHLDHTSFIDAVIPSTKVLIEQKGLNKDMKKPIRQADGTLLTPFQQAKRYITELPVSQHPRWVITCNFSTFYVYDMEQPGGEPEQINLSDLEKEYYRLSFLVDTGSEHLKKEMEVSIAAGEIVGMLYDAILEQYIDKTSERTLKSLNILCVRLVFCLYAEDSGIFGKRGMFHDYLQGFDAGHLRKALIDLFEVLDTKPENRDPYLEPELAAFPYVNGGLFADEKIEIPRFTDSIRDLLLVKASANFDWSEISPTIFGAVFESTLNPETRRSGGMHYTSIENIHKVIDPLFLNDLNKEFESIRAITVIRLRNKKLDEFRKKLASLTWLDPACGSGNFLTETYLSIRRLENKALYLFDAGQMSLVLDNLTPIQVSISQFYGIEINDFAVTVAKTALWIAESQMLKQTEDIIHAKLDFLPLKTNAHIVEGNALLIDWEKIVPKNQLSFIMGNPPFVGGSMMSAKQKAESVSVLGKIRLANSMDYVCAWYFKAARYINNTSIRAAFVSTNSITQGEQVAPLWGNIMPQYNIDIDFAYKTFRWDSEANIKAHVHCVIIGFSSKAYNGPKYLYSSDRKVKANNISPYLIDAPTVIVDSHVKPICNVPSCVLGNTAKDKGYLLLTEEEKVFFINKYPVTKTFIRPYIGGRDFLHNDEKRYCFWLKGISPSKFLHIPELKERLLKVKEFREASSSKDTRKTAETPYLFFRTPHIETDYIIIPRTTSQRRRYIPIGFMDKNSIGSDALMVIYEANLFLFGVLMSNVHAAWLRTVGGRLKSDYRYSAVIVYNSFPWPDPTDSQKKAIEQTAKNIIDARALYPDCSLAELYDEAGMPPELRKAHQRNDAAVLAAYGITSKDEAFSSESACVAHLMKLYKEKVSV